MKKLKIKKRMTSFLMLAVMAVSIIGIMPKTTAHAGVEYKGQIQHSPHYNYQCSFRDDNGNDAIMTINVDSSDSNNIYLIEFCDDSGNPIRYYFASYGNFMGYIKFEYKDHTDTYQIKSYKNRCSDYGSFYNSSVIRFNNIACNPQRLKYKSSELEKLIADGDINVHGESYEDHFCAKVCNYEGRYVDDMETVVECGDGIADGSEDNPFEDKDIGTIVLKSHGFISTKNEQFMGDVSCSYDYYFKYKDKTSSGFSLTDNKYARTFIEVKVQNQCVLYDKDNKDVVEEYYPHYGEYYTYKRFPLESINNNTLRVGWGDIYSKWNDYSEHPVATNKKLAYRFMIRVVCTDSLTVIPDEKSGWHAGGWRSILFDGSKFIEETNGHVDKDGKWKDDEDDGHNNSSDKTSHNNESKDDVDKIMDDDSSSSSSVSSIKSFLNDVGNVPKAIGKLFSFLPSWCTDFIAFGFVVLVALMIIKAIRG